MQLLTIPKKEKNVQRDILDRYLALVRGIAMPNVFTTRIDKRMAKAEYMLHKAFDEAGVRTILGNLGDATMPQLDKLPNTFAFTWENIQTKGKKKMPMLKVSGWGKYEYFSLKGYEDAHKIDQVARALAYWLIKNDYYTLNALKVPNYLFSGGLMDWILAKMEKKCGCEYQYIMTKEGKIYIKKKEVKPKSWYTPAMFDGGKKPSNRTTFFGRIGAWFKNDLKKKYRWEE